MFVHVCTVHQQYQSTFLSNQLMHTVPSSTVYRTLAHRLICRHDIDHVVNDEHNRTIIVVLAKHGVAP